MAYDMTGNDNLHLAPQDHEGREVKGYMFVENNTGESIRLKADPPWLKRVILPGRSIWNRNIIQNGRDNDPAFDTLWNTKKLRDIGTAQPVVEDVNRTDTAKDAYIASLEAKIERLQKGDKK